MISVGRSEERHSRSLGVTTVLLLNGNHREITDRILPDSLYVGNSRFFKSQPNIGGAQRDRLAGNSRRHTKNDWILAIHYVLNFHHRFVTCAGRVVTGPLAKWPFRSTLPFQRHDITFDRQLGGCRNRQPGFLATNHLNWFIAQPAGDFYFRYSPRLIPAANFRQ